MATTKKKTEPKKDYVVARGKPPLNRRFAQPEGNIPNNRGRWKPEDSISYQYHYFLSLTVKEFNQWAIDHPDDQRTMAQEVAFRRVYDARNSEKAGLYNTIEITDRTEGKAKQGIQMEVEQKTNPRPFEGLTAAEIRKALKNEQSTTRKSRSSKRA